MIVRPLSTVDNTRESRLRSCIPQ